MLDRAISLRQHGFLYYFRNTILGYYFISYLLYFIKMLISRKRCDIDLLLNINSNFFYRTTSFPMTLKGLEGHTHFCC